MFTPTHPERTSATTTSAANRRISGPIHIPFSLSPEAATPAAAKTPAPPHAGVKRNADTPETRIGGAGP